MIIGFETHVRATFLSTEVRGGVSRCGSAEMCRTHQFDVITQRLKISIVLIKYSVSTWARCNWLKTLQVWCFLFWYEFFRMVCDKSTTSLYWISCTYVFIIVSVCISNELNISPSPPSIPCITYNVYIEASHFLFMQNVQCQSVPRRLNVWFTARYKYPVTHTRAVCFYFQFINRYCAHTVSYHQLRNSWACELSKTDVCKIIHRIQKKLCVFSSIFHPLKIVFSRFVRAEYF